MSQQGNGVISPNDLMAKLVMAKKVMDKVETGTYEKGNTNINTNITESYNIPEEYMDVTEEPVINNRNVNLPPSIDRIQNSKLPDAVKKAMIEKPIQQIQSISLNETLDMNFIKGAKRLMEQEGVSTKKQQPQNIRQSQPQQYGSNIDMNAIAVLIENTVRKVLDEKLNQILTAQTTASINENLVLKVGDSIFKGKITGVNKSK